MFILFRASTKVAAVEMRAEDLFSHKPPCVDCYNVSKKPWVFGHHIAETNTPEVVTAKGKFSCLEHILAFGRISEFLEVASSLPKVITAKGKFSCLEHIFGFGKISGFWQPAR